MTFESSAADTLDHRLIADLRALPERVAGPLVFTTSFGLEDQVLTHLIAAAGVAVRVVTLDTGRLFAETYQLWADTEERYGLRIGSVHPDAEALAAMVADQGVNGFRHAGSARLRCCGVRKVEPLGRALAGASGWITGLRSGRAAGETVAPIAWDQARALWKISPLADWSREQVSGFAQARDVPVNPLHAAGYPSIGCQPCTRAVAPGEPERAGRWWWEDEARRECGLHLSADGRLARAAA